MSYLKRIILVLITVIIFLNGATTLAHSGRTDAAGGHHDRISGGYHYHHGMPAHQHVNGVCPYASSANNSESLFNSSNSNTDSSSKKSGNGWVIFLFAGGVIIAIYKIWERSVHKKAQQKFLEEKKRYTDLYAGKDIATLVSIPANTSIGNDGLPKDSNTTGWGMNHTVYIASSSSGKYHRHNCQHAGKAIHAYYAQRMEPCKICKPKIPNYSWYKEYLEIVQIKKKYGIE